MSEPKNDGGPAFPTQTYDNGAAMNGLGVTVTDSPGISIRDYFAAAAMRIHADNLIAQGHATSSYYGEIARESYMMADAMLAARKEASHE